MVTLVFSYLKSRWLSLAAAGLFVLFLLVVPALYGLPLEPVGYGLVLAFSCAVVLLALDFTRYRRKLRQLAVLREQVVVGLENLPKPADLVETRYQELLQLLFQDRAQAALAGERARQDLVEYYTLWVHQVKTPISALRLILQTEELGEVGAELEGELFKIERYVEMVLQYLRVESPSTDFVFRRASLDKMVRQAVRKYSKVFIRKGISLAYQDLNREVLTDEKWLTFVLEQLLDNALKYTAQGKIAIYLEGEGTLVLEDTGLGIAPEDLPRIFQKGYTGLTGRLDKRSSGIGLYLCRLILEKLGHEISVESEVGKGTKIRLNLASSEALYD